MANRVAMISLVVEDLDSAENVNSILHEYAEIVVGRMGIPYREREISLISVAVDGPEDIINAVTGKLGRLSGVTAKTAYSNVKD